MGADGALASLRGPEADGREAGSRSAPEIDPGESAGTRKWRQRAERGADGGGHALSETASGEGRRPDPGPAADAGPEREPGAGATPTDRPGPEANAADPGAAAPNPSAYASTAATAAAGSQAFLAGGGSMGARIRAHDWTATPLGPPVGWPPALRTAVGLMLQARQPMLIVWGAEHILLYNDAAAGLVDHRHPAALGRPLHRLSPQLWESGLRPQAARIRAGQAIHVAEMALTVERDGVSEKACWAVSATPLLDQDGAVAGALITGSDVTETALLKRHLQALAELGASLRGLDDPDAILRAATHRLGAELGADRAAFVEVDPSTRRRTVGAVWRAETSVGADDGPDPATLDEPLLGELRAGREVAIPVAGGDASPGPAAVTAAGPDGGLDAVLAVPVLRQDRLAAILVVRHRGRRRWGPHDVELAREVAGRAHAAAQRARTEARLRAGEARHGFLLTLTDALRPIANPLEIQAAATRVLGERLGASRVAYFEMCGGDYCVERDYTNGVPSVAGRHPTAAFGRTLLETYEAGRTAVGVDVTDDPALTAGMRAAFEGIQIGAYIGVPLIKHGRFIAGLAVHMDRPRAWTPLEIALAEETAERTWAAVERARAEAALRESEARLAADLAGMRRLHDLHARLASEADLDAALGHILAAATDVTGTDRGTVQLVATDGLRLDLEAHRGFGAGTPFTEHFRHQGSLFGCDIVRRQRRLVIEDIENFPDLAGTRDREVSLADGIRAAQSTPMVSRTGEIVGVLSTQHAEPCRPDENALRLIDLLAWTAADFVERHRAFAALRDSEERLSTILAHAPLGIGLFDREGRWLFKNPALNWLTGPRIPSHDLDGRGRWQAVDDTGAPVPPKDWPGARALRGEAASEGVMFRTEVAGRDRWFRVTAVPVLDEGAPGADGASGREVRQAIAILEDVTERELAEERQRRLTRSLALERGRLAAVLRHLPVGVWIVDPDGRLIERNAEAARIGSGAEPPAPLSEPHALDGAWNAPRGGRLPSGEHPVAQALATGEPIGPMELGIRRLDGSDGTVLASAAPVRDEEGRLLGAVGINLDITERARLEAALRRSEERLRLALDAAGMGTFIWHPKADRPEPDERMLALFGQDQAAQVTLANALDRLIHPEDRARYAAAVERTLDPAGPGILREDIRINRPDGTRRWLSVTGQVHFVGGVADRLIGAVTDVTRRREVEAALRESRERLRLAQEVAGVGTFEWMIQTNVNRWSPEIERLYGLPVGGFAGSYQAWAALVHPDDLAEAERRVRIALETGRFEAEWRVVRPDGTIVPLLARGIVERDSQGRPLRMIGANVDITARVRAEEHQRLLMAELDHRVKNVLAAVQSVARQSLRDADPEAAERFTGRLGAFARSHALLAEGRWRGASLRRLIEGALSPYREEDGAGRVTVEGPEVEVGAKAAQTLSLAAHELVTNAAKHGALAAPGGRVAVGWELGGDGEERRLVLTWQETGGPPIAAPPVRRGFGTRLIRATVTYDLAGTVELDFRPDGLVATLALPSTALSPGTSPDGAADEPAPGEALAAEAGDDVSCLAGRRILLVEDQHLIAEQLAEAMRAAACHVVGPAPTLAQARALAEAEPLDAAVLDVNLDGEMIWPVAEALAARGVPLLLASGYADPVSPPAALRAAPRMAKPVAPEDALAALAALLRRRVLQP